jgi:hypothetical protein
MTGIKRIAAERKRQIEAGWNDGFVDGCLENELSDAAVCYAFPERSLSEKNMIFQKYWPWRGEMDAGMDRISQLVKAGALIAAEIDRLQRLEGKEV